MRQIILDTETTGLEPEQGHRIVELAAVEYVNRRPTRNNFHRYLNPERESDERALEIHGLTAEFLQDKPLFAHIADEFIAYISDAELIIHNASFDLAFLNAELAACGKTTMTEICPQVIDTLKLAKDLHPGKRNNLNALCERYEVDNSRRTLHGALLDAQLLGEVYLAMTRGQETLLMDISPSTQTEIRRAQGTKTSLNVLYANAEEVEAHQTFLDKLKKENKGACLWQQLESF
ncbi:MAG: DNA polymerase III subunit epsilon [Burkholderiales bacterium]